MASPVVSDLNVTVDVDQRTMTKTLTFSRPVTVTEASTFLFGTDTRASLLTAAGGAGGKTQRYVLGTLDVQTVMSMRPTVRDAIVQGSALRSTGQPYALPEWVPATIQNDVKSGKLPKGVTRYKTTGDWGDIVVWKGNATVEIYQEFPADLKFYEGIAGEGRQARLLHFAYTQFTKDMNYFVETKGMSPEQARSEIRRINEEVFKLIIEGAAGMLAAGAGITQVQNMMRQSAPKVADAAKRSKRFVPPPKIRPVNGKVNVGGGFETPNMSNLNPIKPNTGGPTHGIPNHVRGAMEQMDELFESGSVDYMMSSKLRYVDVNWEQGAKAAARVMRPGGKVEMNVWCGSAAEAAAVKSAFERAGFKNVIVSGDSVGTMVKAVR